MALAGAPQARYKHFAAWTGKEMLIWGGRAESPLSDGGLYDPATDTWRPIVAGADQHPDATAAWTGSELFVWGGRGAAGFVHSGFLYHPETSAWRAVSTVDAPEALGAAAVQLGGSLILSGGAVDFGAMAVKRYDIDADEWHDIASDGAVDGFGASSDSLRFAHGDDAYFCRVNLECAVYSSARDEWRSFPIPEVGLGARLAWANSAAALVLFGGQASDGASQAGAVYDLESSAWHTLPTDEQPAARWEATFTPVSDRSFFLWGGQNETYELEQDGNILNLDAIDDFH